jgi:hypothetical protein
MKNGTKVLGLLIILVGTMFYWITRVDTPSQKVISMLILVLVAYLLGRAHQNVLTTGRNREDGGEQSLPSFNGGYLEH